MRHSTATRALRPSLQFVKAINVELTYGCQFDCPHCLQADHRARGEMAWADPGPIQRALTEALDIGLIRQGVNFTGGEILRADSPLPLLLETTQALGIPVHLNTNGWWGHARQIQIGERHFDTAAELIAWFQSMGVALLALSMVKRFVRYPALWSSNVAILRLCERLQQPYELIFTGLSAAKIDELLGRLAEETGTELEWMTLSDMERVDIGAASGSLDQGRLDELPLLERLQQTDCGLRGFYRPAFLHIAPGGGVRSCLYAVGAGWLGNIHIQSLTEIVAGFAANPVVRCFSGADLSSVVETQWSNLMSGCQRPRHPCALAVDLARGIDERA